jgi:prephenate dehydratase
VPEGSDPAYRPRVAFQGEAGAFSELAATQMWGGGGTVTIVPSPTFEAVLRAVESGAADYGVIPVENTTIGPVPGSREALAAFPGLVSVDETVVAVRHCLLALPGATFETLARVLSHAAALAQCRTFLVRHPHLEVVEFYDTAGAAREIARLGDPRAGAIAGRHVADRYGLRVLVADIADSLENFTRFVAVAPRGLAALGGPI